jgi:hypothetical protein
MEKELIPYSRYYRCMCWIKCVLGKGEVNDGSFLLEAGSGHSIPSGNSGNMIDEVKLNFSSAKGSLARSKKFLRGQKFSFFEDV